MRQHAAPSQIAPPDLDWENPSYDIAYLSRLDLSSTVADLPTHRFQVDPTATGLEVAKIFDEKPELPGVIVVEDSDVLGAFSRRKFFEQLGQLYGVAVYHRRPIGVMLSRVMNDYLILPNTLVIHRAAERSLRRPIDQFYEPIIVQYPENSYCLLDTHILLLAQSHILNIVYQQEQTRRELAEAMQKIGNVLTSSLNVNKVTKKILKQLDKVLSYKRGAVMLQREDHLEIIAQRGFAQKDKVKKLQIPIRDDRDDLFCRIVSEQDAIIIDDVIEEPSWQQQDWLPLDRSWLGVPLISQNKVIGMISLTRKEIGAFGRDDIRTVLAFAGQAAIALENAHLYDEIEVFNTQLESLVEERTAALNKAYHSLEQLEKRKSDFVRLAAHEFRTPLTVIKGYAQVLGSDQRFKNDSGLEAILDGVTSGVDRMTKIVNSLLDITKIDSGTLTISEETVQLREIFLTVYKALESALEDRHLSLTATGLEALPDIVGDPDLLAKMFHALIINAIKYTPDGGIIKVRARTLCQNGSDWVQVAIQDSGIGINPDQHSLVFEKFYQTGELSLHSSGQTNFKGGGPGLGLSIARGIVDAHGGEIWVESPGHDEETCPGSTFIFTLPVSF